MPETRSAAKEYLRVYTEQFLFWKKCDLDDYPWLNQATYKIDEIYMDVHKIVDNKDVSWLLDGLSKQDRGHEIVDAVNKMLIKRLNQSVAETRRIFDEAVKKDHALQEYEENRENYYRLINIRQIVRKNGIEISDLTAELKKSDVDSPCKVSGLIKISRYVRPSFFVQMTTENYTLEVHKKYSNFRESDHNKCLTMIIEAKIKSKKDVISSNKKGIDQLEKDLHNTKSIIHNLESGSYKDKYSKEKADNLLSSNRDKVVLMTARIKQARDINNCLQREIYELEREIY